MEKLEIERKTDYLIAKCNGVVFTWGEKTKKVHIFYDNMGVDVFENINSEEEFLKICEYYFKTKKR